MRRCFRFTIRDLLCLTLVVALGLGWFIRERQLSDEVNRLNGVVSKWRQTMIGLNQVLQPAGWQASVDIDSLTVDLIEMAEPREAGVSDPPVPESSR
jgi:hypothetical protein